MSDASNKLAQSRKAIVAHIARKQRRHDPREETLQGEALFDDAQEETRRSEEPRPRGGGWFGRVKYAVRTWWRYHPAHMAVDLASPTVRGYARRKPMQLLGISLAAGALFAFARPWKVLSLTTILIAVLKSSQLSGLVMAAMSAADYETDGSRPE